MINAGYDGVGQKPKDSKYCKHCGAVIDSDCVICPKCGKQVEQLGYASAQNVVINGAADPYYWAPGKSKVAALLLAIFLGTLGIHRFYVGRIGTGIIWLLTLGIFGIGWLVDIILIACGAFRDKYSRPLV